uniref:Uncharacterized protein n=1 Tax=Entomoneis paludosa TaxID=265537 RepID=A0A7S3DX05_9STRA
MSLAEEQPQEQQQDDFEIVMGQEPGHVEVVCIDFDALELDRQHEEHAGEEKKDDDDGSLILMRPLPREEKPFEEKKKKRIRWSFFGNKKKETNDNKKAVVTSTKSPPKKKNKEQAASPGKKENTPFQSASNLFRRSKSPAKQARASATESASSSQSKSQSKPQKSQVSGRGRQAFGPRSLARSLSPKKRRAPRYERQRSSPSIVGGISIVEDRSLIMDEEQAIEIDRGRTPSIPRSLSRNASSAGGSNASSLSSKNMPPKTQEPVRTMPLPPSAMKGHRRRPPRTNQNTHRPVINRVPKSRRSYASGHKIDRSMSSVAEYSTAESSIGLIHVRQSTDNLQTLVHCLSADRQEFEKGHRKKSYMADPVPVRVDRLFEQIDSNASVAPSCMTSVVGGDDYDYHMRQRKQQQRARKERIFPQPIPKVVERTRLQSGSRMPSNITEVTGDTQELDEEEEEEERRLRMPEVFDREYSGLSGWTGHDEGEGAYHLNDDDDESTEYDDGTGFFMGGLTGSGVGGGKRTMGSRRRVVDDQSTALDAISEAESSYFTEQSYSVAM